MPDASNNSHSAIRQRRASQFQDRLKRRGLTTALTPQSQLALKANKQQLAEAIPSYF